MPSSFSQALPILRAVDALAPLGGDAPFVAIHTWLTEHGHEWDSEALAKALDALKHDGYVQGMEHSFGWVTVGLSTLGRQTVAGWPSAGAVDAEALANAIVAALNGAADDPDLTEETKGALRRLTEGAASTVVNAAVTYGLQQAGLGG